MRLTRLVPVLLLLVPLVGSAGTKSPTSVEGRNGWTATEVFRSTDLTGGLSDWRNLGTLYLVEAGNHQTVTESSGGDLYVRPLVESASAYGVYTGVVHYDGSGFRTVVLEQLSYGDAPPGSIGPITGTKILNVYAVPSGVTGLGTDDLLLARLDATDGVVEIVRYPASGNEEPPVDTASEEVLFRYDADFLPQVSLAAGADGDVYLAGAGLRGADGGSLDGTIRELSYDSTSGTWSDARLVGGVARFVAVEGDFVWSTGAAGTNAAGEVLRIDPETGDTHTWSTRDANLSQSAWTFDEAGTLWLDLRDAIRRVGYVLEAPPFDSADDADRIADVPYRSASSLAVRAVGGLYLAFSDYRTRKFRGTRTIERTHDTLWRLEFTGESGGKGRGHGRGHGKSK